MEIRLVTPSDDRAAISRVYEESWKFAYKGIVPQDYLSSLNSESFVPVREDRYSLVLLEKGKIVGTSSYCKSRLEDMPDWGEIVSIYLLPGFMDRGLGKPLLEAAVKGLADMGYGRVFLWVLEDNLRARRFYEKNGFVPSGRTMETEIGGKTLREAQYVKED